jgi:hypothetical protein
VDSEQWTVDSDQFNRALLPLSIVRRGKAGLGHFPSPSMNQYAAAEGYCRQRADEQPPGVME